METDRAQFSTIKLKNTDLQGIGEGLQLHCLTASDDLSAVALVNTKFNEVFGKKLLNEVILEFRKYWQQVDPESYLNRTEDVEAWDETLMYDELPNLWEKWQNPEEADKHYQMEAQLHMIKDIFLDNLDQVMKRGEQLDVL